MTRETRIALIVCALATSVGRARPPPGSAQTPPGFVTPARGDGRRSPPGVHRPGRATARRSACRGGGRRPRDSRPTERSRGLPCGDGRRPRHEEVEAAGLPHEPRREGGALPTPPEEVDPAGAPDRPTRVLVEDEARERTPADGAVRCPLGLLGIEEGQGARREEAGVGRDGAPRREGPPEAPLRRAGQRTEEDERLVVLEHALALARVGRQPGADRLHRHGLAGHAPLLDQEAPDRPVGPAVGAGIADALLAAVREAERAAPLDLHEEDVDRIARPRELETPARETPRIDLRPPPVRDETPPVHAAEHPFSAKAGIEAPRAGPRPGRREDRRPAPRTRRLRLSDASTTGS